MLDTIEKTKELLLFKYNWDGDGAKRCDVLSYHYAITSLLMRYYMKLDYLPIPEISLCDNGSIDIVFRRENIFKILINVSSFKASFYGDTYYENKIKGNIDLRNNFDNELFKWLEKYVRIDI